MTETNEETRQQENIKMAPLDEMVDDMLQLGVRFFISKYNYSLEIFLEHAEKQLSYGFYDPSCFRHRCYSDFIGSLTLFLHKIAESSMYRDFLLRLCALCLTHGISFNMSKTRLKSFLYAFTWAELLLEKVCLMNIQTLTPRLKSFLCSPQLKVLRFNMILWNFPCVEAAFGSLALLKLRASNIVSSVTSPPNLQSLALRQARVYLTGPCFKARIASLANSGSFPSVLAKDISFVTFERMSVYGPEIVLFLNAIDENQTKFLPGMSILY